MAYGFLDIAVTPSVHAAQVAMGTDHLWQDFTDDRTFDSFTPNEAAFIAQRDSFYMATVSETGWPYVQHRGGPPGFLKLLDDKTLAFADYRGNRQYISLGNLNADGRAALFLMDYAQRAGSRSSPTPKPLRSTPIRISRPASSCPATGPSPNASCCFTWRRSTGTCSQHITRRFTEAEISAAVQPLRDRLAALEAENAGLRDRLAAENG